jgi:Pectate lyase superfamily protein
MTSAINPDFITTTPVSKTGMKAQLQTAKDEITALQSTAARSVRTPASGPELTELPSASLRANKALAFTSTGDIVAIDGGEQLITAHGGSTLVALKNLVPISVASYGAVGDGVTDDTAAFQAAHDACVNGGTIFLDAKFYRLSGKVTITKSLIWQGSGWQEGPQSQDATPTRPTTGTWLWHDNTDNAFQIISQSAQGTAFRDLAFWEAHPTITTGWAPTSRAACVRVQAASESLRFEGVHFHNAYWGIDADNCGRVELYRVTGQPLWALIKQDKGYDMGHWDHVHCWPYWSAREPVMKWLQTNGIMARIGRVDGIFADHILGFGYAKMFWFYAPTGDGGSTTKFYFGDFYSDCTCRTIEVDQDNFYGIGNSITMHGADFTSPTGAPQAASVGILFNGGNGRLQISNLFIESVAANAIRLRKGGNNVTIGSAIFRWFSQSDVNGAAVQCDSPDTGYGNSVVRFAFDPIIIRSNTTNTLVSGTGVNKPLQQNMPAGFTDGNMLGNELRANAAAPGNGVALTAFGSDNDIVFDVITKGIGRLNIGASTNTLSFFGGTGRQKPTVTGSRGGNVALQSLITALTQFGLINDTTT